MKIVGLRHIALGVLLSVAVTGCSHKHKRHTAEDARGYGAFTQGTGQGTGFAGSEQGILAERVIHFNFDRSDIREEDIQIVQAHAEYLRDNPQLRIRVEGHTDERGSREYNVALGERRARSVANTLVSQGAGGMQIATVSFGKEKLVSDGHDEQAHGQNRRAVIVYEN